MREKDRNKILQLTFAFSIILIFLHSTKVNAQQQAIPTHLISGEMNFTMGKTDYISNPQIPGFEVNFWTLPIFQSTTSTALIMQISNQIAISLTYDQPTTKLGFKIDLDDYNTGNSTLPSSTPGLWVNLNLRVQFGNYTLLNGWQGNDWFNIAPSFKILIANNTPYHNDTTLSIRQNTPLLAAHIADIRIFTLAVNQSWAQYMRQYSQMTPTKFAFSVQQIYLSSNTVYYPTGAITSFDLSALTLLTLNVTQCPFYKALQSDGTCSASCLTTKCLVCQTIDKKYFNLCRYCDPTSSSCLSVATCPTDYYLEHGVCYRCPPGCSACLNYTYCTSCDSGLITRQELNYTVVNQTVNGLLKEVTLTSLVRQYCDCPDGQFGTTNVTLDQIQCAKCDASCLTCANSSVTCTSCASPKFLYNSICVTNCSEMQANLYGETSNRTCNPCASNCSACTGPTGCTNCKTMSINGTSMKLLNFAGVCVSTCPGNSIPRLSSFLCDKCLDNCTGCDISTTNCTTCVTNFNLYRDTSTTIGQCLNNFCPRGFYPKNSVCTKCDISCTVCDAENYCTECLYVNGNPAQQYYFVNYQCKLSCPEKYYPDNSNTSRIFCRNCPSNCLQCTDQQTCTVCTNNYYLSAQGLFKLCVLPVDCPQGQFPQNASNVLTCANCKANCKSCSTSSNCFACNDGYFLDRSTSSCVATCPINTYAMANNTCASCIPNCQSCSDSISCDTCATSFLLLENTKTCVAGPTCSVGYYLSAVTQSCKLCRTECSACTGATVCTGCIIGFTLSGSSCIRVCGNGVRQQLEQCDDGNSINGDGCSSDCMIESGYVCEIASPKDICRCNPFLQSAEWTDNWGSIRLEFDSMLSFYSISQQKSSSPYTFCSQIIDSTSIGQLGSYYECSLIIDNDHSILQIDVGSDSQLGSSSMNFNTQITLVDGAIRSKDCLTSGIPTTYSIQNLPLDTPMIVFAFSSGSNQIGMCSSDLVISIFNSKGLTKRNIQVNWAITSMTPSDVSMVQNLQNNIFTNCANQLFCIIDAATIQSLSGKQISLKATVINFLGISNSNQTTIVFGSLKRIEILDIPDVINFAVSQANQILPRFRLPYCSYDSQANIIAETASITYTCQIFSNAAPTVLTSMTNCTIPANFMSIALTYTVRITAQFPGQSSYTTVKNVFIQPDSPDIQVAMIQGCNRVFHPDRSFQLTAIYNTQPSTTQFSWGCIDVSTGSTCFSTTYSYISLGNTETITIGAGLFFYDVQYNFYVKAYDTVSNSYSTYECTMTAAKKSDRVLDLIIVGETTYRGFIDFSRQTNSFKAYVLNSASVNISNVVFTWQISDSSGKIFADTDLTKYQNSVGISTSLMNMNSQYTIFVSATDGSWYGNASQVLDTLPDVSIEFTVQPNSGTALETVFTMTITSQVIIESLNQYVYGYLDPIDGVTKRPLTQKTYKRFLSLNLPQPSKGGSSLTCYVDVILPNGLQRSYYYTVTVNSATMSAETFKSMLDATVMDDIIQSIQVKDKLVALASQMTVSERSAAIKKILQGLKGETTPLSDFYIQTSACNLLEYISTQTDCLMQDSSLVTQAAAIFNQITIQENSLESQGLNLQFTRASTINLFNFANNIFQKDYSALIGIKTSNDMKTSIMAGLNNVLKGSLTNQILGDNGGFSYQGLNIFAKAVKFDSIENNFTVTAQLPQSLSGKLSQDFVSLQLPSRSTTSNPCRSFNACQISVIILDSPVNTFISNQKESTLKSMFVDISIQSAEVTSPNTSYVSISDLVIKGLTDPIRVTIPLISALNTSNQNRTLGCGYLDESDGIFKSDGLSITKISNTLVTCRATHLTAIGVEEFTSERTADETSEETVNEVPLSDSEKDGLSVNIMNSWALYVSVIMLGLLGVGMLWSYRKDKRDALNFNQLRSDKDKLYIGVFLEPIVIARKEKQDTEKLVTAQELQKDSKKQTKQQQQVTQYEQLDNLNDTIRNSMILPGPAAAQNKNSFNIQPTMIPPVDSSNNPFVASGEIKTPQPQAKQKEEEEDFFADNKSQAGFNPDITGMTSKSKKTVKKKKKKKKGLNDRDGGLDESVGDFRNKNKSDNNVGAAGGAEHNIFFEGGEIEFCMDFEGGSDEEIKMTEEMDAGAESIKSKRSKKKKKKRGGSSARGSSFGRKSSIGNSQKSDQEDGGVVEDFDDGPKSARSNRSGKSQGGKKKKKKPVNSSRTFDNTSNIGKNVSQNLGGGAGTPFEDDDIQFNNNIGQFGIRQEPSQLFVDDTQPNDDMNVSQKSRLTSKSKKKKKKKGSRAGSRQSSRSSNESGDERNLNRPDLEAEPINSKRTKNLEVTNKQELLKPLSDRKLESKQRVEQKQGKPQADDSNDLNKTGDGNVQTKGFDTLMAEANNGPNLEGVPKVSTKKSAPAKRAKPAGAVARPKRFQQEQAGCCVFFCWNCRESHRVCSLIRHYNEYLSRSSRLLIFMMSMYMYIMITGFLIDGQNIINKKDNRGEQLVCGLAAALISKFFIILVTNLMRHPRRDKIYMEYYDSTKARNMVKFNTIKYWVGVGLCAVIILISFIFVIIFSSRFIKTQLINWGWAYLFAIIGDFVLVEGIALFVQTIITLIVGAAPDACGKCRNCWLEVLLQSIKDTVK